MRLIIDSFNLFIRSWASYPAMSSHGYQIGGVVGYLKTLSWMSEKFCPTHVYVVWEAGGSSKRRKLLTEYKKNRGKSEKLNRFYGEDIPETEENKVHQIRALTIMLKHVPVKQLYVSNCEGDDVIAYLCDGPLRQEDKIIVSTDKDMYQLMNDKTKIYNLYTKKLMSYHDIVDQYLITASNFGIAKAICGDVSDNISGIKGVGFKTLAKHIDVLRTHEDLSLKDVFSYCYSHRDESKVCNKIIESKEIVERNWALIHLDVSSLSASQSKKIEYQINQPSPIGNKIDLMKELMKEGVNNFDVSHVFSSLALARATAENEKKDLDDKDI